MRVERTLRVLSLAVVVTALSLFAVAASAAAGDDARYSLGLEAYSPAVLGATRAGASDEEGDEEHGEEHDASGKDHGGHHYELSTEAIPLQLEGFPQRPKPLLELGEPFLGTGTLAPGFELPTGAFWQPSFLLFGTLRLGAQSFDSDAGRVSEVATRLDLFGNLALSGTERIVIGLRLLDRDGRFTRYVVDSSVPGIDDGFEDELNLEITSLFFEGDFGEIFPNLSIDDFTPTDIGFSVGRQPLLFQEGILINDSIDGIGLTRNTLQPKGTANFRATLFFGWNDVGSPLRTDTGTTLTALLTSTDFRRSTVDADIAYVASSREGDLLTGGISAVQRIGKMATSFRLLGSSALDEESATATDGALAFAEFSLTPAGGYNLFYWTAFWAVDEFSSAARGPATGGPLGRAGINFAAVGLGSYGAALSSFARDVAGGAIGYQWFWDKTRRQAIVELGTRIGTRSDVADAVAATVRYQAAYKRRFVFVVDGFLGYRDSTLGIAATPSETLYGGRLELVVKF